MTPFARQELQNTSTNAGNAMVTMYIVFKVLKQMCRYWNVSYPHDEE
jgi:hypothetical protein